MLQLHHLGRPVAEVAASTRSPGRTSTRTPCRLAKKPVFGICCHVDVEDRDDFSDDGTGLAAQLGHLPAKFCTRTSKS